MQSSYVMRLTRHHSPSSVARGLTPPSSGRSEGRFAPFGPPLMANGRLIPTDPVQLMTSAVANVKRGLNDDDWCQALRADASCRQQNAAAPVAAAAPSSR